MEKVIDLLKKWQHYCCEDLSNIENYDKAIEDPENYVVHHRLGEITAQNELKEHDLYYNRPAKELLFLTRSQHASLHAKLSGWHSAQKGTKRSKETTAKILQTKKERDVYSKRILCLTNGIVYDSASLAAAVLGVAISSNIYKCCYGERKTANGYRFKFYENGDDYTCYYCASCPLF